MNLLTLFGHLGRDPESRTSKNGTEYWILNVAERLWRKEKDIYWWRVIIFRTSGNALLKSLRKGNSVIIHGELEFPQIFEGEEGEPTFSLSCMAYKISLSPFMLGDRPKANPPKEIEKNLAQDIRH